MYKIVRVNLHIENVLKKSYCQVSPYSRLILFHARDQKRLGLRPVVLCVCVCVCVCWGGGSRGRSRTSSRGGAQENNHT